MYRNFYNSLVFHPHANLYAVCQRTANKLNQIGDSFGVEKRYTDFDELLQDPEIDAVHINTPVPDHALCHPLRGPLPGADRCHRGTCILFRLRDDTRRGVMHNWVSHFTAFMTATWPPKARPLRNPVKI